MFCTRLAVLISAFMALLACVEARNSHRHGSSNHARRGALAVEVPAHLRSCDTTILSWTGTQGPYSLGLLVGSGANAPLYHLAKTNSTSYRWAVDLVPNTTVTIAVKGASGIIAYSRKLTIEDGTTSCLSNSSWVPARNASITSSSSSSSTTAQPPAVSTGGVASVANVTSGIGAVAATATSQSGDGHQQATAGLGLLLAAGLIALVA